LKDNIKTIEVYENSNYQNKLPMQNILEKQNKFEGYLSVVSHLNHLRKHKHVGKKYLYRTIDSNKH
jgi:hypothetical protein